MRLKFKIIIPILIGAILLVFTTVTAFAKDIIPAEFSEYINCYKNDIYTEATYLKPLTKTDYYNVGTECFDEYGTKEIKASKPKYNNYGFKVNGEFYITAFQLTESGTYKIEVFFYEKNSDGFYQAHGSAIETFYVFVDLGFKVTQNKTKFCYESYDNELQFIDDVKASFNQKVDITINSQTALKNAYNSYNGESKAVGVSATFKSIIYNFTIHLIPLKEIKASFYPLSEVIEDATMGQAYLYESSFSNADYLNDVLGSRIVTNVYNNLKLADGQRVEIAINDKVKMKAIGSASFQTYLLALTISEKNSNEELYFNVPILIYKTKYLIGKSDYAKIDFESYEYYENQTVPNSYHTYLEFKESNQNYRDEINAPILTGFALNNIKKEINYKLELGQYLSETYSKDIEIVTENKKTKILTKYNYIVLPKKNSLTFENQIKIICNEDYFTTYDTVEIDGADWLTINVISKASNETILSKNVKITYLNNEKSWFNKFLAGYGAFLRKIFS